MFRLVSLAAISVFVAAACAGVPGAPPMALPAVRTATVPTVTPTGDWNTILNLPSGQSYRLGLDIDELSAGAYSGTISSPDQGRLGSPLESLDFAEGVLSFITPSRTSFSGRWDATTETWSGDYTTPNGTYPLRFARGVVLPLRPSPAIAGVDGRWEGNIQGMMPIVVRITTDESGTLAWMDSPTQQSANLPIPTITRDGSTVSFAMPNLSIAFTGDLSADGSKITGMFKQGQSIPFELAYASDDTSPTPVKPRPQTPAKPYPYKEEEVAVTNTAVPGLTLNCTLTSPSAGGPHPAAIMLTGSGTQDRDETIMGHKPFLVLADHLTRKGIAVLRCDDRDVGKPADAVELSARLADVRSDAKAQLAWLRSRVDIDPRRTGIIGHSEGGVTGPSVAADDPQIAFVVSMAGIGVTGKEALLEQRVLIAQSMGGSAEEISATRALFGPLFEELLAATSDDVAKAAVVKAFKAQPAAFREPIKDEAIAEISEPFASPYFRDVLAYDAAPVLAKLNMPFLAINGSKDVQVEAKQNLNGFRRGLAHNRDVTIVDLPDLNHLFQTAPTGAVTEYASIDETFAPAALDTISEWIVKRMKP